MPRQKAYDHVFAIAPKEYRKGDPCTDQAPPETKIERLETLVSDLSTQEDYVGIMEVLRDARKAITTIRAPREILDKNGNPLTKLANNYEWVPDHATRLAAVRLHLSYISGMPTAQVKITQRKEEGPSVQEQVEALRLAGTDIKAIVDTWVQAAKPVQEALQAQGKDDEAEEITENAKDLIRSLVVDV